jgi:hypothetical protein
MIRKSGNRFSEKIMLKQVDKSLIRFNLIASSPKAIPAKVRGGFASGIA